jgi:hypothetical protein
MTFDLTLWLAKEICFHGLFPKIPPEGNLRGVPREKKFARIRVRC